MTLEQKAEQSYRLLLVATKWFALAAEAVECGDKRSATVARMAHQMCRVAHLNLESMPVIE